MLARSLLARVAALRPTLALRAVQSGGSPEQSCAGGLLTSPYPPPELITYVQRLLLNALQGLLPAQEAGHNYDFQSPKPNQKRMITFLIRIPLCR